MSQTAKSMSSTKPDKNLSSESETKDFTEQEREQNVKLDEKHDNVDQRENQNTKLPSEQDYAEQRKQQEDSKQQAKLETRRTAKKAAISRETRDFANDLFDYIWCKQKFNNPEVEEAFAEEYSSRFNSVDKNKTNNFNEDIGKAVRVSQILLREYLKNFFRFTVSKKSFKSDVKWLVMHWLENRDNIFVKIVDLCAIITEAFLFCDFRKDYHVQLTEISDWFVEWFEENFAEEFFRKGGWKELKKISFKWYWRLYTYFDHHVKFFNSVVYWRLVYSCSLVNFMRDSPVAFPVSKSALCPYCITYTEKSLYRNVIYMRPFSEAMECIQSNDPPIARYPKSKAKAHSSVKTSSFKMSPKKHSTNVIKNQLPINKSENQPDIEIPPKTQFYDSLVENYYPTNIQFVPDDNIKDVKSTVESLGILKPNVIYLRKDMKESELKIRSLVDNSRAGSSGGCLQLEIKTEDKLEQTSHTSEFYTSASEECEINVSKRVNKSNLSNDEINLKTSVKLETCATSRDGVTNTSNKIEIPVNLAASAILTKDPYSENDIFRTDKDTLKTDIFVVDTEISQEAENIESYQPAKIFSMEIPLKENRCLDSAADIIKDSPKVTDWSVETCASEDCTYTISNRNLEPETNSVLDWTVEVPNEKSFSDFSSDANNKTEKHSSLADMFGETHPVLDCTVDVPSKENISDSNRETAPVLDWTVEVPSKENISDSNRETPPVLDWTVEVPSKEHISDSDGETPPVLDWTVEVPSKENISDSNRETTPVLDWTVEAPSKENISDTNDSVESELNQMNKSEDTNLIYEQLLKLTEDMMLIDPAKKSWTAEILTRENTPETSNSEISNSTVMSELEKNSTRDLNLINPPTREDKMLCSDTAKDQSSKLVVPQIIISEASPTRSGENPNISETIFKNENMLKVPPGIEVENMYAPDIYEKTSEHVNETASQNYAKKNLFDQFSHKLDCKSDISVSRIGLPSEDSLENFMGSINRDVLGGQPSFVKSEQNKVCLLSEKDSNSFEMLFADVQRKKEEIKCEGDASSESCSLFEDDTERNLETMRFLHCEFPFYLIGKLPKNKKIDIKDTNEEKSPKKKSTKKKRKRKPRLTSLDETTQNEVSVEPRQRFSTTEV